MRAGSFFDQPRRGSQRTRTRGSPSSGSTMRTSIVGRKLRSDMKKRGAKSSTRNAPSGRAKRRLEDVGVGEIALRPQLVAVGADRELHRPFSRRAVTRRPARESKRGRQHQDDGPVAPDQGRVLTVADEGRGLRDALHETVVPTAWRARSNDYCLCKMSVAARFVLPLLVVLADPHLGELACHPAHHRRVARARPEHAGRAGGGQRARLAW